MMLLPKVIKDKLAVLPEVRMGVQLVTLTMKDGTKHKDVLVYQGGVLYHPEIDPSEVVNVTL